MATRLTTWIVVVIVALTVIAGLIAGAERQDTGQPAGAGTRPPPATGRPGRAKPDRKAVPGIEQRPGRRAPPPTGSSRSRGLLPAPPFRPPATRGPTGRAPAC